MSETSFAENCDTVISLGAHCETAEQIARFFGKKTNGPFDWMITPVDSVCKILEDDGQHLGQKLVAGWQGKSIQCNYYGCVYFHEFDRIDDGRVLFDIDALTRLREKMLHKMGTLIKSYRSSNNVLFVRAHGKSDAPGDRMQTEPLRSADLNRLVEVIRSKAPDLNFRLLFARADGRDNESFELNEPLAKEIIVREVRNPQNLGWQGDEETWANALESLGFVRAGVDAS